MSEHFPRGIPQGNAYSDFFQTGVSGAKLCEHGVVLDEVQGTSHSSHSHTFGVVKDSLISG